MDKPVDMPPREKMDMPVTILKYEVEPGLTLVADAQGPEDGQPVLLLHGGGQTRNSWSGVAQALARDGYYAVCLDARGHGESDWAPDGDYDFVHFAGDVRKIIATFNRPPILVGASLGGISSIVAVGEPPYAPYTCLVLVDIVPRMNKPGGEHIRNFMRSGLSGFNTLDDAADAVAKYLPHRPRPKNLDGLRKNLRQREDGRWYWHWDPEVISPSRLHRTPEGQAMLDRAMASIKQPVMLIRGGESDVVTEENAREFKELFPTAELVVIPKAHHMVAGDDNNAFNKAVLDFIHRRGKGW